MVRAPNFILSKTGRVYKCGHALNEEIVQAMRRTYAEFQRHPLLDSTHTVSSIAKQYLVDRKTVLSYCRRDNHPKRSGRPTGSGLSTNARMLFLIMVCFLTCATLKLKEVQYIVRQMTNLLISISQISFVKTHYLKLFHKRVETIARMRRTPRIIQWRAEYRALVRQLPTAMLYFIDETSVSSQDMVRRYGHGLRCRSF